jgi:hypothetical protein
MDFGFLVPIAVFVLIGYIVKTISDNKIRKRALENGNLNESIKHLWIKSYANRPLQNVKWAVIFGGIGVVILFSHFFALAEAIAIGLAAIVVAISLIIYYILEKKKS